MNKKTLWVSLIFPFLIFLFLFSLSPPKTEAATTCPFTTDPPPPLTAPLTSITLKFDGSKISQELAKYPGGGELKFSFPGTGPGSCGRPVVTDPSKPTFTQTNDNNPLTRCDDDLLGGGQHKVEIIYEYSGQIVNICNLKTYTIKQIYPTCKVEAQYTGLGDVDNSSWTIVISDFDKIDSSSFPGTSAYMDGKQFYTTSSFGLSGSKTVNLPSSMRTAGSHTVRVNAVQIDWVATALYRETEYEKDGLLMCSTKFEIAPRGATPRPTLTPIPTPTIPPFCSTSPCNTGDCSGQCFICPGCPGAVLPTAAFVPEFKPLCDQLSLEFRDTCTQCLADGKHIWTAIGCVPTELSAIIKDYVFVIGVGIAGGIAFLYFLYGAFLILTSTGNPEKIEEAKEIMISALSGLILIIFSIFLLRVIGVDILKLPEFG